MDLSTKTQVKIQPATALPIWTVVPSAETNPQQYVAWSGEARSLTYDQATFIAHAANAYPKLVSILSLIASTRGLEERYGHMLRDVNALLKDLGEDS